MHENTQPAGGDFFSGFGQGGNGAPMRDQNGNVITSRAARAPGITNPVSSLDMEELKARQ